MHVNSNEWLAEADNLKAVILFHLIFVFFSAGEGSEILSKL